MLALVNAYVCMWGFTTTTMALTAAVPPTTRLPASDAHRQNSKPQLRANELEDASKHLMSEPISACQHAMYLRQPKLRRLIRIRGNMHATTFEPKTGLKP
jgi:hypothetical protein